MGHRNKQCRRSVKPQRHDHIPNNNPNRHAWGGGRAKRVAPRRGVFISFSGRRLRKKNPKLTPKVGPSKGQVGGSRKVQVQEADFFFKIKVAPPVRGLAGPKYTFFGKIRCFTICHLLLFLYLAQKGRGRAG